MACSRASAGGAGAPTVVILSLLCIASGVMLAGTAPNRPVQQAVLEGAGGSLIVLGLAIIGAALPLFR